MKTSAATTPDLEELATKAVRLGRELHEMAQAACAGGSALEFGFVDATLRRLAEREPFDARDKASLDALRGILETDLQSEVVGSEQRFFETRDDDGEGFEMRDCAVYSARGQQLLNVQKTLFEFLATRDATLDRIAAGRAVLRLLRA